MEFADHPADPAGYLPPRPISEEDQMHEVEERAHDIRARLHQDMHTTAVTNGVTVDENMEALINAFISDAMFQIEHLLIEVEAMRIKDRAKSGSVTEPLGWPADD